MAYSDPLTITIGTKAYTLARLNTGSTNGKFVDPTGQVVLEFTPRINNAGRKSVAARLSITKVTTDPLVSTTNVEVTETATQALNMPSSGFTESDSAACSNALATFLSGSDNAALLKLIRGES